eukprot:COSAG01_NODE_1882_length_8990_cov_9.164323_5_plen_171_part_00
MMGCCGRRAPPLPLPLLLLRRRPMRLCGCARPSGCCTASAGAFPEPTSATHACHRPAQPAHSRLKRERCAALLFCSQHELELGVGYLLRKMDGGLLDEMGGGVEIAANNSEFKYKLGRFSSSAAVLREMGLRLLRAPPPLVRARHLSACAMYTRCTSFARARARVDVCPG